jgi:MFS family permease
MEYCVDVITADSTKLKNRAFAYAFTSSPYIITAFAGPKVGNEFYDLSGEGWRWGFGTWAIIFPITAAPLFFTLRYQISKAQKQGHMVREPSGRTFWESVVHWTKEFDCKFFQHVTLKLIRRTMCILILSSDRRVYLHRWFGPV